jgi:hypothetical protein
MIPGLNILNSLGFTFLAIIPSNKIAMIKKKENGFSLMEMTVSVFFLLTIITSLIGMAVYAIRIFYDNKSKLGALMVGESRIEEIRNLVYEDIGTIEGPVFGVLNSQEVIENDNGLFFVNISIDYFDDPYDGLAGGSPLDSDPEDYKIITVNVEKNGFFQVENVQLFTIVTPLGVVSGDGSSGAGEASNDLSFQYAAHSGEGGLFMRNSSKIYGDLIASSSIEAKNSSQIHGDVTVAHNGNFIKGVEIFGDVRVDYCEDSTVHGVLYCNTHHRCTANEIIAPLEEEIKIGDYSITKAHIDMWKAEAEAGGVINRDYVMTGSDTASLGPIKINGNLNMTVGAQLNMTGFIWVTGNISINNSAAIKLDNAFQQFSSVVIADGEISLDNTAKAIGSDDDKSYLILISTSDSVNAILAKNQFEANILFAPNGEIELNNTSNITQVTAYRIRLENKAELHLKNIMLDIVVGDEEGDSLIIGDWKMIK